MSPRWNWDFEDEKRPAADTAAPPPPEVPSGGEQPAPVQRRRRLAAIAVVVAVASAAAVAALSGSHHQGSGSSAALRVAPQLPRQSPPGAPGGLSLRERKAVNSVFSYTPFVRQGGTRGREVALTFDDGPGPYTPGVLDVLERHHALATFFAIGRMERYFSASTTREIEDGDVVGDHTENHPALARLSAHDQHEELFEQIARVERGAYGRNFDRPDCRGFRETHDGHPICRCLTAPPEVRGTRHATWLFKSMRKARCAS